MAANVVVVADPAFAPAQPDQGVPGSGSRPIYVDARSALVPRGGGLAPLPGARKEAEAIRRYCPGATVLYGAEAQESALRLRLSTAGLIHLATHGVANDAAPMMSGVALAAPANSADDGVLTAREIMEMDLRADLVVLSACDTGRGTPRAGEGLLGLAWALSAAGARSQVLARWAVSDNSTAVLMDRFYSGLAGGKTRAAALRSAAASLRRDGTHGHPYYWAPFFLLGEWGH
jgi:CHAT domain-containing protein